MDPGPNGEEGNNEELDEGDNQQVLLQQIDELEAEENEGAPSGQKTAANIPDFLPAAQRALFLRIQQKQQEEEEKAKRRADSSQQEKDNEEGGDNWYSSDEEEGGSSMSYILKTLRQQSAKKPQAHGQWTAQNKNGSSQSSADPRLKKERTQNANRPVDPRISRDPRLSRSTENTLGSSGSETAAAESRTITIPKAEAGLSTLPSSAKSQAVINEEEGERILREKVVTIPLDPLPGSSLRDPRSQLKQFSHIKMDISLGKPHFAKSVLWSPEDLIPLPIPKPDPVAVPAPFPALDPRLNRSPQAAPSDPRQRVTDSAAEPPQPAPISALPDIGLLSRILKTVDASATKVTGQNDKPSDPRMRKLPADPRLQRSTGGLQTSNPQSVKPSEQIDPPAAPALKDVGGGLAPYDPRVVTAGGQSRGGGGGQSTMLSGISLYDPRTPSNHSGNVKNTESSSEGNNVQLKGSDVPKGTTRQKEPLFVRKSTLEQLENEKSSSDTPADRYNSYNRPRPKPAAASAASTPETGQTGVHSLPVPSLFGLVHPQFSEVKQASKSGSGSPFGGNSPLEESEQDATSLKEVFKGFDPTASPFCQ